MPDVACPRIGCGVRIPTKIQFEPKVGPLGNLLGYTPREVVSQDDLRAHLLAEHKPKGGARRPRLAAVSCRSAGCVTRVTRRLTFGNSRSSREILYCTEHAQKAHDLFRHDITADEEIE